MIRALLARVLVTGFFVASNVYMLAYIGSSLSVMCGGPDWHARAVTEVIEFFESEEPTPPIEEKVLVAVL